MHNGEDVAAGCSLFGSFKTVWNADPDSSMVPYGRWGISVMASYAERVKKDILRWSADWLIDAGMAERLSADIEANARSRISFPTIFAMMAAALLCAAVLLFVAANWEEIPRLVRVGMLAALIVGGYVGGAVLKLRGAPAFGEGAWLVAAASFGAAIALVAQMYHMSGEEKDAVLTWFMGTALAAIVLRSSPLTVGAALLTGVWMCMAAGSIMGRADVPWLWLLMAGGLWLVSYWSASQPARHLLSLLLIVFTWMVFLAHEVLLVPMAALGLAAALFFADRSPKTWKDLLGLGVAPAVHGLVHLLSALAMLHYLYADDSLLFVVVLLTFAALAGTLLVAGQRSRTLRWLVYAAFVVELSYAYIVLLGTMLGTAGFLLLVGLGLAILAWGIGRLETKMTQARHKRAVA